MGKIFQILLAVIGISVGYTLYIISQTKSQSLPIPYTINNSYDDEASQAAKADILVIGDQSAELIKPGLKRIIQKMNKKYKSPLKVFDWTRANEGIHRTYQKVAALKKVPSIVIYLGGSSEFYEKLFDKKYSELILKNFSVYENPNLKSLFMLSPIFGKLLFRSVPSLNLSERPESQRGVLLNLAKNDGAKAQKHYEVHYKIFNTLFSELISLVKFSGSSLITLTVPVKVTNPPKYICDNATSETIIDLQVTLEKALKSGTTKRYYSLAKGLTASSVGNAKSFYLFGKFNESLGRLKNALFNYRLAQSFDCYQNSGNFIINQIIRKHSLAKSIHLIDFDAIVHREFGEDFIFLDHYRPQVKYMDQVETRLENKINILLNY